MPRPARIEYDDAFYHVMNRGRARNDIFFTESHYSTFLKIIEEACEKFGSVIHAYCLMPNHYHLLIQTPNANLGRVMRHINGVYTQRFNKIQKIDGPLFRGRYKAILVQEDEYLLELSKYIHNNPVNINDRSDKLTDSLQDYKWSSYPSYLNLIEVPKWLNQERVFSYFKNDKNLQKRYQSFVESESNKEIERFFDKENRDAILGKVEFKQEVLENFLLGQVDQQNQIKKEINDNIKIEEIINVVAEVFNVTSASIYSKQQGQLKKNIARSISVYLVQKIKAYSLRQISEIFNFNNVNSPTFTLCEIKKDIRNGFYKDEVSRIEIVLGIGTW